MNAAERGKETKAAREDDGRTCQNRWVELSCAVRNMAEEIGRWKGWVNGSVSGEWGAQPQDGAQGKRLVCEG